MTTIYEVTITRVVRGGNTDINVTISRKSYGNPVNYVMKATYEYDATPNTLVHTLHIKVNRSSTAIYYDGFKDFINVIKYLKEKAESRDAKKPKLIHEFFEKIVDEDPVEMTYKLMSDDPWEQLRLLMNLVEHIADFSALPTYRIDVKHINGDYPYGKIKIEIYA